MASLDEPIALSPQQFEAEVEKILRGMDTGLKDFRTQQREDVVGADGSYNIDVTARFEVLGCDILVLVECKQHRHPIKREVVQVLSDRLRSVGAHKGMIFSTVRFQEGAVEYALKHGIALVQIADGHTAYITRTDGPPPPLPPEIPPVVGWLTFMDSGEEVMCVVHAYDAEMLTQWFTSDTVQEVDADEGS